MALRLNNFHASSLADRTGNMLWEEREFDLRKDRSFGKATGRSAIIEALYA
jgi:hypothetical protein